MLESVAGWIIHLISSFGYFGIFFAMVVESALIPLPSEIIMPFSGYLVATGRFNLLLVALSGAVGNVIGSLLAYYLGYWGHERVVRRLVRRWGRWILFTEHELDTTEALLHKYKDWVVLGSRVVPGVRTVISLPCGIARLPLLRFIILTFLGSFVWSLLLAGIGVMLGKNWHAIGPFFHQADIFIVLLILIGAGSYVYFKLKH
jgi:membrane protein DedA with SNARE-associated domain